MILIKPSSLITDLALGFLKPITGIYGRELESSKLILFRTFAPRLSLSMHAAARWGAHYSSSAAVDIG